MFYDYHHHYHIFFFFVRLLQNHIYLIKSLMNKKTITFGKLAMLVID